MYENASEVEDEAIVSEYKAGFVLALARLGELEK